MPPAQAISAIARARQVVLAGDSHQLPDELLHDGQRRGRRRHGPHRGMESILDVLSSILPNRRLRWHYRSLDERLITFANEQVYAGNLVTFPGTDAEPVLRLETVDGQGIVDEGSATVESTRGRGHACRQARHRARPHPAHRVPGVIALGLTHAQRIDDALRVALVDVEDEVADFFEESSPEPFFVKNLEAGPR